MQDNNNLTIKTLFSKAKIILGDSLDSEALLCHVLGKDRAYLFTWTDKTIDPKLAQIFLDLVERRKSGIPLAYIIGKVGFMELELEVNEHVLIPRADTETLVNKALEFIDSGNYKVLDLGTGSGAIALAISHARPNCSLFAVDKSEKALEVAKKNAKINNINNVRFVTSDWYSNLDNIKFDFIVTNPPYIEDNDPHLTTDIKHEPLSALTSGKDGLDDIREIVAKSKDYLSDKGMIFIEHGYNQAEKVREILHNHGFKNAESIRDFGGNFRVSLGSL